MKFLRYEILLGFVASFVSVTASGSDIDAQFNQAVGAGIFWSQDNEGFSTRRISLEYSPFYRNADWLTGMRLTTHKYEKNNWSRSAQQLVFFHRNINPATAYGWQLNTGLLVQEKGNLLTLEGAYRRALTAYTGLELLVNRDLVETEKALDSGIHFNFVGASLERGLGKRVTLLGLVGRQEFSDDNARNHGRLKLIFQPNLDSGLTLQARYRTYTSSTGNTANTYFNPARYDEAMLALGWRKKIPGWNASVTGGVGQQSIASGSNTATHLLEGSLQSSPDRGYTVRVRAGFSQSAALNGPNYRYRYLLSEWTIPF